MFKGRDRYVVLAVAFALPQSRLGEPVRYAALAAHLGVEVGAAAPAADVRAAVLDLRRAKGMVLDPDDHDTWSAGSFFTNPILDAADAARLPAAAPALAGLRRAGQDLGGVADRAGRLPPAATASVARGVSSKHTLALTNRGGATTDELLALAREIRDGVRATFRDLVNEPGPDTL